jgi:hypothetical protein
MKNCESPAIHGVPLLLNFVEKLVVFLTVSLALGAALAVGGSTYIPFRSGVDKAVINSEIAIQRWLDDERRKQGIKTPALAAYNNPTPKKGSRNPKSNAFKKGGSAKSKGSRAKKPGGESSYLKPKTKEKIAYSDDYFSRNEPFPDDERVRGIPWLRREYNVIYFRPQPIPPSLVEHYQSLEAATELIKEPGGRFEETPNGTSFTVTSIPKSSYLNTVVGLQPGDKILSVNGIKITGVGFAAAKSIYEEIKGASKFAVKVERQGRIHVLSFTVKRRR